MANTERRINAPFLCLECNEELILKTGRRNADHFAHVNPLSCEYAIPESKAHLNCKIEIYQHLLKEPNVTDVQLERRLGTVRPDVSAIINGVKVAIEVQISSLSLETITRRTIDYHQRGIYVLWLLQWNAKLDAKRYSPALWEKWIHAAYFGRVYYWKSGLSVVPYQFEPSFRTVPHKSWHDKNGRKISAGGYSRISDRYRTPIPGEILDLTKDFGPTKRYWWEGGDLKVPDARLFMERSYSPRKEFQ